MRALLVLLVVLLAVVVGVVAFLPGFVEARVEDAIARAFDRARDLRVEVELSPIGLAAGRLESLHVTGEDLVIGGLATRRLDARLFGVSVDVRRLLLDGQLRIRVVRDGQARLVVGEEGVATYMMQRRGLRDVVVRITDGEVAISGETSLLGMRANARLSGAFAAADGALYLRARTLTVSAVTLSGTVADALIAQVNPILTPRDLGLPLRITGARMEPGRVVVLAAP